MKIGFVGLGIMDRPMALNLKNAGHELIVPERKSLTDEVRAAAEVVADAKTVASKAEIVILMVPDTPDVEAALRGLAEQRHQRLPVRPRRRLAGLLHPRVADEHFLPERGQRRAAPGAAAARHGHQRAAKKTVHRRDELPRAVVRHPQLARRCAD